MSCQKLSWCIFAQKTLGPRANPKGCSERRKPTCWRKQREVVPKGCLFLLSSFPTHPHIPSIGIIFHFKYYMVPEELFGSLVSLFNSGLGTPPKLKTNTISVSLVAYQFLECYPAGLDQSTKITWKLWLAQSPVHFFFILFPSPFEFWVIL